VRQIAAAKALIASRCRKFGVKHRTLWLCRRRYTAAAAGDECNECETNKTCGGALCKRLLCVGEGGKNCVRYS